MQTYFHCLMHISFHPKKECAFNNLLKCILDEMPQFPDCFRENPLSHLLCTWFGWSLFVTILNASGGREKLQGEYLVERGTVRRLLLSWEGAREIGHYVPLFNQEPTALCKTYLRNCQMKPMVWILGYYRKDNPSPFWTFQLALRLKKMKVIITRH